MQQISKEQIKGKGPKTKQTGLGQEQGWVTGNGCWNKIRLTNITLRVGEIVKTKNV